MHRTPTEIIGFKKNTVYMYEKQMLMALPPSRCHQLVFSLVVTVTSCLAALAMS